MEELIGFKHWKYKSLQHLGPEVVMTALELLMLACEQGDHQLVTDLVQMSRVKKMLNSDLSADDFSPLSKACEKGNITIVKILLEAGADIYFPINKPAIKNKILYPDLRFSEAIKIVIQKGALEKSHHKYFLILKLLLEKVKQQENYKSDFVAILIQAAYLSQIDLDENKDQQYLERIILYILEMVGEEIDFSQCLSSEHNESLGKMLFQQAYNREWNNLLKLISRSELYVGDNVKKDILELACRDDKIEVARTLLESGVVPTFIPAVNDLPLLCFLIAAEQPEMIGLLIHHGIELNQTIPFGIIRKFILKCKKEYTQELKKASENSDADSVPDVETNLPDYEDDLLVTPLFLAVAFGRPQIALELLNAGAIYNGILRTPILDLCEQGKKDALEMTLEILEKKGTPLAQSDLEYVLFIAAQYGHVSMIEFLIKKYHLNVNAKKQLFIEDEDGSEKEDTPLFLALNNRQESAAIMLVRYGAVFDQDIFLQACSLGFVELAKLLQQRGMDCKQPDKFGKTPLAYACFNGQPAVVEWLLEQKVDFSLQSSLVGESLPLEAIDVFIKTLCKVGHLEFLKKSLQENLLCNVNLKLGGESYLSIAIIHGQTRVINFLLDQSAEVDENDMRLAVEFITDPKLFLRIFDVYRKEADEEKCHACLDSYLQSICEKPYQNKQDNADKLILIKALLSRGAALFVITDEQIPYSPLLKLLDPVQQYSVQQIKGLFSQLPERSLGKLEDILKVDSPLLLLLNLFYKIAYAGSKEILENHIQECHQFLAARSLPITAKLKENALLIELCEMAANKSGFALFENWLNAACHYKDDSGKNKTEADYANLLDAKFKLTAKYSIFIVYAMSKITLPDSMRNLNAVKGRAAYKNMICAAMKVIVNEDKQLKSFLTACEKATKPADLDKQLTDCVAYYLTFLHAPHDLPSPGKSLTAGESTSVSKKEKAKPSNANRKDTHGKLGVTSLTSSPLAQAEPAEIIAFEAFETDDVLAIVQQRAVPATQNLPPESNLEGVCIVDDEGRITKSIHCSDNIYIQTAKTIIAALPAELREQCFITGTAAACLATGRFEKFSISDLDFNIKASSAEIREVLLKIPGMQMVMECNLTINKSAVGDLPALQGKYPLLSFRLNNIAIQVMGGDIIPGKYRDFSATSLIAKWEKDQTWKIIDSTGFGVKNFAKKTLYTCHPDACVIFRHEPKLMLRTLGKQLQGFRLSPNITRGLLENFELLDFIDPFVLAEFYRKFKDDPLFLDQGHANPLRVIKNYVLRLISEHSSRLIFASETVDSQASLAMIEEILKLEIPFSNEEETLQKLSKELSRSEALMTLEAAAKIIHFLTRLKLDPQNSTLDVLCRQACHLLLQKLSLFNLEQQTYAVQLSFDKKLFLALWEDLSHYHFICNKRISPGLMAILCEKTAHLSHRVKFHYPEISTIAAKMAKINKKIELPVDFLNYFFEYANFILAKELHYSFSWETVHQIAVILSAAEKTRFYLLGDKAIVRDFFQNTVAHLSHFINQHYFINDEGRFHDSCLLLSFLNHFKDVKGIDDSAIFHNLVKAMLAYLELPNYRYPLTFIGHAWQGIRRATFNDNPYQNRFVELLINHTRPVLKAHKDLSDHFSSLLNTLTSVVDTLRYLHLNTAFVQDFLKNEVKGYLQDLKKEHYHSFSLTQQKNIDELLTKVQDLLGSVFNQDATFFQRIESEPSSPIIQLSSTSLARPKG